MKTFIPRFIAVLLALCSLNASAATHYVDANGTNATPPYSDWTTAAVNIQDAIDASTNGDIVLVTNGVYAGGGQVMAGGLTNRVALTNAITVQSVNGPWVTTIQGAGAVNGPSAVRCAWLTNNATLIGFTLKWGATASTDNRGGGVWCASSSAVVDNCVIVSNTAISSGAGVYQGRLNNCLISSNGGSEVGYAVYNAILNSCTIVGNTYGGVILGAMTNCIVYYNTFYNNPANGSAIATAFCCTTPLPSGKGNFTNAPQLFADGVHLLSNSPCIGAGTNLVTGMDIFGQAWANPPSIGCAEYYPVPVVSQPQIVLSGNPFGFAVNAAAAGPPPLAVAWLQDGVPLQDNGHFSCTQTTNLVVASVSLADAGSYQLVVSNASAVVTSGVAQLVIHCVDAAGTNPAAPYSTWATAATNIQDAITASFAGDIVLVTNGLYATGGKSMDGVLTNRVSVDKAIRVQSVNGPWVTAIQGAWDPVSTNGPAAVRCAWLMNNAALTGFTLQWGATRNSGVVPSAQGGGVWCASSNAAVANCVIVSNTSYSFGTGAYQGTLNNCLIHSNGFGGGAWDVYNASINSCTIVGNSNYATYDCTLTNCIVYYNNLGNYSAVVASAYCCTTPAITGLETLPMRRNSRPTAFI
jgi:parallel beta-helix repeat protein